jgi:hypothetical protein
MYKSHCKNCDHNIHTGFCPVAFLNYSAIAGDPGEPVYCGCDEYIPKDNLEYLEYKYIRRRQRV